MSVRFTELTPRGRGGVSVVALTGSRALDCLRSWINPWPAAWQPASPPRLVRLHVSGLGLTEEALVWWKGAEAFELHLHGSPPLVDGLCQSAREWSSTRSSVGADLEAATGGVPGLFDQARGLELRAASALAEAETRAGARVLLDQAEGALRTELTRWLNASGPGRVPIAAELADYGRTVRRLLEPARVVIAGPVNMGKSTLFNLLLGAERVVVSDVEGTTRDVIEAAAQLGAYPIRLLDTAGQRVARGAMGVVEAAGQELGQLATETGDWVLWMTRDGVLPTRGAVPMTVFVGRGDEASPADSRLESHTRLAPLADPAGTLHEVRCAFLQALDLPAEPRRPGRGVAFDSETRALVDRLVTNKNPQETEQAVHAILS